MLSFDTAGASSVEKAAAAKQKAEAAKAEAKLMQEKAKLEYENARKLILAEQRVLEAQAAFDKVNAKVQQHIDAHAKSRANVNAHLEFERKVRKTAEENIKRAQLAVMKAKRECWL